MKTLFPILLMTLAILIASLATNPASAEDPDDGGQRGRSQGTGQIRPLPARPHYPDHSPARAESLKQSLTSPTPPLSLQASGSARDRSQPHFHEDPHRPGYPLGWITNSPTPLLQTDSLSTYLSMEPSLAEIYIGRLIPLSASQPDAVILAYASSSTASLVVTQLSSDNAVVADIDPIALPTGEHEGTRLRLSLNPATTSILLMITKHSEGHFTLRSCELAKGEGQ